MEEKGEGGGRRKGEKREGRRGSIRRNGSGPNQVREKIDAPGLSCAY